MHYFHSSDIRSDKAFLAVEYAFYEKASFFKIHIIGKRLSQVASADNDKIMSFIKPEYLAYLFVEIIYIVTVTLLTETSEMIEILSYLGRGYIHSFRKFA